MTGTVTVAVVASGNVTVVSAVVNTVRALERRAGLGGGLEDGGDLAGQRLGGRRLEASGTIGNVAGMDTVPGSVSVSVVTLGRSPRPCRR